MYRKFGVNRTQPVGGLATYVYHKIQNGGKSKQAELRGLRGFFVEQVQVDMRETFKVGLGND